MCRKRKPKLQLEELKWKAEKLSQKLAEKSTEGYVDIQQKRDEVDDGTLELVGARLGIEIDMGAGIMRSATIGNGRTQNSSTLRRGEPIWI